MSLLQQIDDDLKKALKSGDKHKATVLRGLKSDLKYKQISVREELSDTHILEALSAAAKKRRESIEQFTAGGRDDLVQKEQSELAIITAYLPDQLREDELRQLIKEAIEEAGADSPQQLGQVMKILMPKVKGRADGKLVNKLAAEILAK
jgi:uncharacterized protein YqeY